MFFVLKKDLCGLVVIGYGMLVFGYSLSHSPKQTRDICAVSSFGANSRFQFLPQQQSCCAKKIKKNKKQARKVCVFIVTLC